MRTQANERLVSIDCPLCGSGKHVVERILKGFQLVRCQRCRLVFVNPQLSLEDLYGLYRDQQDPQVLIEVYARLATPSILAGYDRTLDSIKTAMGGTGRILDFACAGAYFVERARDRGWDAFGTDLGHWTRIAANARGVENVLVGELSELNFPPHFFDVIYAAQVLEHLQSPLKTLSELRRILRPDGILYVDVPNYRTIPIILGLDDFYLNGPPQHINYFTPGTLRQLLERSRFDVVRVRADGGLKWENLIGRPVKSEIADAYRGVKAAVGGKVSKKERVLRATKGAIYPFADKILYDWAKLGVNLVALSRRGAD